MRPRVYFPTIPLAPAVVPFCRRRCRGVVIVFAGIGFEMRSKYQHHREKSADKKQGEIPEKLLSPAV